jgi:hypothetical protein
VVGWKDCCWIERFIADDTSFERDVVLVKLEKGSKQAIVLTMGRKCRNIGGTRGIPSRALRLFVVPVETI